MSFNTSIEPPKRSILAELEGEMVFRIHEGGTSRQVAVTEPKCWIGSSRSCTLRIQAPGVQPVHCLVARGVRQAALFGGIDATLDGKPGDTLMLQPGDHFSVGPVEIELVHLVTRAGQSPPSSPVAAPTTSHEGLGSGPADPLAAAQDDEPDGPIPESARVTQPVETERQEAQPAEIAADAVKERLRAAEEQVHALREVKETLQQRVASQQEELEEQRQACSELTRELDDQRRAFQNRIESERTRWTEEAREQARQLTEARQDLQRVKHRCRELLCELEQSQRKKTEVAQTAAAEEVCEREAKLVAHAKRHPQKEGGHKPSGRAPTEPKQVVKGPDPDTDPEGYLQDYMVKLLNRDQPDDVQQTDTGAKAGSAVSPKSKPGAKVETSRPTSETPTVSTSEVLSELPRSSPGGGRETFGNLRKLANDAARAALEHSRRRRSKRIASHSSVAAVLMLVMSTLVLLFHRGTGNWGHYCALVGLLAGIVFALRAAEHLRRARATHPAPRSPES